MASLIEDDSASSLPSTTTRDRLLKMDSLGRVRISRERREAILDEFEQSGVSAPQFAKMAGIRYSTFVSWASRRRKSGKARAKMIPGSRGPALHLVEAVVDPATPAQGLVLQPAQWGADGADLGGPGAAGGRVDQGPATPARRMLSFTGRMTELVPEL